MSNSSDTPRPGILSAALSRWSACLLISLAATASHAAKDTPFGVEFIPPNYPNSTDQEALDTFAVSAQVGGHSSLIWHWSNTDALSNVTEFVPLMHQYGMKSLIQIGAVFITTPGPPDGYVKSFGDPRTRQRYILDVARIAWTRPDYLVLATEINLLHRFNPAEFEYYRTLYKQAYFTAKAYSPNTKVGVSFLYSLWFADYVVNHVDVPALISPADFVAFTTYPEWLVREGYYASIEDIPPEFHGQARVAYPDARILFSEVGWASKVLGTPEEQARFVRNIPRLLSSARPELVTWAVLHDVEFFNRNLLDPETVAFLEGLGVDIDALFGHFNAMGLRDGFGNPKPAWSDAEAMVFPFP